MTHPKSNAELSVEQDPAPRPAASGPGCLYCSSLPAAPAPFQKGLRFFLPAGPSPITFPLENLSQFPQAVGSSLLDLPTVPLPV